MAVVLCFDYENRQTELQRDVRRKDCKSMATNKSKSIKQFNFVFLLQKEWRRINPNQDDLTFKGSTLNGYFLVVSCVTAEHEQNIAINH